MNLMTAAREFPQFGRSLSNVARTRSETFDRGGSATYDEYTSLTPDGFGCGCSGSCDCSRPSGCSGSCGGCRSEAGCGSNPDTNQVPRLPYYREETRDGFDIGTSAYSGVLLLGSSPYALEARTTAWGNEGGRGEPEHPLNQDPDCPEECKLLHKRIKSCCAMASQEYDRPRWQRHLRDCFVLWHDYIMACSFASACPEVECTDKFVEKPCCHPSCEAECREFYSAYAEEPRDQGRCKSAYNRLGQCCNAHSARNQCLAKCMQDALDNYQDMVAECTLTIINPIAYAACILAASIETHRRYERCVSRCPERDEYPWRPL